MMIEKLGAKNPKSSGRMMIEKVMIQLGANSSKIAGGLGGWGGGGGSPSHDDRKSDDSIRGKKSGGMMIENVMIQLRAKNQKNSGGVGGGRQPPP